MSATRLLWLPELPVQAEERRGNPRFVMLREDSSSSSAPAPSPGKKPGLIQRAQPPGLHLFLFFAAYVIAGGVGQGLAIIPGVAITFWPPAGIFAAMLLLYHRAAWPWWILTACLAELTCNVIWFHNPVLFALIYFSGNALEAVTAAWLINRFVSRNFRFETPQEVGGFLFFAVMVAPITGATVIATTDALLGKHPFHVAWPLVWLGDATGLLVATPIVFAAIQLWREKMSLTALRLVEIAGILLLVVIVTAVALAYTLSAAIAVLPLLVWVALRFQLKGAAVALALMTLTATVFTSRRWGVFGGDPAQLGQVIILLQAFLALSAVSVAGTAVFAQQHERTRKLIRMGTEALRSERRLFWLIGLLPWLTLTTGAAIWTVEDYSHIEEDARAYAVSASGKYADHVQLAFAAPLAALENVQSQQRAAGIEAMASSETERRLAEIVGALPFNAEIAVYDREGDMLNASSPAAPRLNAARLAVFGKALQNGRSVQIGGIERGTLAHRTAFPVAKALTTAQGTAVGVVIMSIDPRSMESPVILSGSNVTLSVYSLQDGALVLRQPYEQQAAGQTLVGTPAWDVLREPARQDWSGYLTGQDTLMISANKVEGLPLAAVAAVSNAGEYSEARAGLIWRSALLAAIGLAQALLLHARNASLAAEWHARNALASSEQRLREADDQRRLALDAGDMGTWRHDIASGDVRLDERGAKLFDLDGTHAPISSILSRVAPEDRPDLIKAIDAALDPVRRGAVDLEYCIHTRNGGTRWLAAVGRVEFNGNGPEARALYGTGTVQDITHRKAAEAALRHSEAQLRLALESADAGTWSWRACDNTSSWDAKFHQQYGFAADEPVSMEAWQRRLHPDDRTRIEARITAMLKTPGDNTWDMEFRAIHPQLGERWMLGAGRGERDSQGSLVRLNGLNFDVTTRRHREDALKASEAFNRRVLEASPDCIMVLTAGGRVQFTNSHGLMLTDCDDAAEYLGLPWASLWPDESHATVNAAIEAARAGHDSQFQAVRPTLKDAPKWWDVAVTPVLGDDRRCTSIVTVARDITERKRQEMHQHLMMHELNHRVKNTLATVQSMALQTLRTSPDLAMAGKRLGARLSALGKAHDLLTREKWESAPLRDVVERALAPFSPEGGGRFSISGPDVRLDPRVALALSMALHELCTNAIKHGALSNNAGRVTVTWTSKGKSKARMIRLKWVESGGARVTPPAHHSFGSRLIEKSLAEDLGGTASLHYRPGGVVCDITLPLGESGTAMFDVTTTWPDPAYGPVSGT